jgi:outer membrane protein assembly factor BamA
VRLASLLAAIDGSILGQATADQQQKKRFSIGLSSSQVEGSAEPAAGAEPLRCSQSAPGDPDDTPRAPSESREGEFNRHRITFLLRAARARYEFFGIGNAAGSAGESFWLSQHGHAILLERTKRLKWSIFVGPRFVQRQIRPGGESSLGEILPGMPQFGPIQPQLNRAITSAGFGLRVDRDKRSDNFYPRSGGRINGKADFTGPYVGSTFSFQSYQLEVDKYLPIGQRQVLALRGMGCGVTGSPVPFFELCQFGMMGDLRGYRLGRYRDRTMFATQAEWRTELWKRLGGTVFGGVGEVAPQWSAYTTENLLPSGGLGLRCNLSKQRKINLRRDLAYIKTGGSWSMGAGEVF